MAYYDKSEAIAQAVLDAVVARYATESLTLPTRRLIGYPGMPLDCEQLAVLTPRMYQVGHADGPAAEAVYAQRCVYWAGVEAEVILTRCTPQPRVTGTTMKEVPVSQVEDFASTFMKDPHVIAKGIRDARAADDLGLGANLVFLDSATLGDESGFFVGWRVRFRVGGVL